jgi:hypothetical protein
MSGISISSPAVKRIITSLLVVAVALLVAATANAAVIQGRVGTAADGTVICDYDALGMTRGRITFSPGYIGASFNLRIASNGALITNPWQWVKFQPHVSRWNEWTRTWEIVASYGWKLNQVNEIGDTNGAWLNLRTNQREDGTTYFNVYKPGYYTLYVEYYWYASPQDGVRDGYYANYAPYVIDHMSPSYMGSNSKYCNFRP